MKRREVLKNLGFGVTAGIVLPAWLSSCSDDESNGPEVKYDGVVGIVGAGAAGLAVADYLLSKGVNVKIFEASSRVGGRIASVKQSNPIFNELAADFHVELGADRIIGTDSEFGKIIRLLKVPRTAFRETTNAKDYYIIDNGYKTQAEAELLSDFQTLKTFRDSGLANHTGGGSVETAAGASSDMNDILNSWLGNAYGSSADQIGANALGEAFSLIEHDKKEIVLLTNPIDEVLTSRFEKAIKKVQLNSPVKTVTQSGDGIVLTFEGSAAPVTVNKLVVTAPIPVLNTKITFDPALPTSKLDALSRIGMDASIRVIIEFTNNSFLGTDPFPAFIFGGTKFPSYFLSGIGKSKINRTMSITVNGPKAQELTDLNKTDDEIVAEILGELDLVFGGKASLNVRRRFSEDPDAEPGTIIHVVKNWTKEPYIGGGISYPKVGGTNADREALAEPVNEKIFFAGEATDVTGEFGTISGALKSGVRAAGEVIAIILEENAAS